MEALFCVSLDFRTDLDSPRLATTLILGGGDEVTAAKQDLANSDAPEPHYRLGRMELDHAKPKPAVEHLRMAAAKAPEQAPWRADLYFQLAQAELLTGAKAAALADFKKFLDISPPDTPSRHEAKQQVARLGGGKMQLGGTNP